MPETVSSKTADRKWPSLILLAIACMCVLSLWFTATAALPGYVAAQTIAPWQEALLSSSVQAGFVVGSLVSAFLGLPDRIEPRRFFAVAALTGATANALFLAVDITSTAAILCRFITGAIMAGIYPVGMKIAVSWADRDAGLLVGLLVAAFTLGTAAPYLFGYAGDLNPTIVLGTASAAAVAGAGLIFLVRVGPDYRSSGHFQPLAAFRAWREPAVRRANYGYFGHMWELYAFWAWVGLFTLESFTASGLAEPARLATLTAFLAISVGTLGALLGGLAADRIGRTALTSLMLLGSGACCLLSPLLFGLAPWIMIVLALVWGIAVIGDSAQFSTAVA
ncbi:MAG: MFS transporter, partial [Pseudomonadota bacterium]